MFCDLITTDASRCPGCSIAGVYRDSVERRVTDVPVVGHPLELRVRVPRYRCCHDGCEREIFVHDTSRLARAGASTTRRLDHPALCAVRTILPRVRFGLPLTLNLLTRADRRPGRVAAPGECERSSPLGTAKSREVVQVCVEASNASERLR